MCSCELPIIYFNPTSGYDMVNEMLLYCKCVCYFASIWNLLIQLETKVINRPWWIYPKPKWWIFLQRLAHIYESHQNQETLQNTNWFNVLYRASTSYCKAISLKCRQLVSWGTSLSFFVLADKMRYFCFRSVGIFQSTINQSNNQSINQPSIDILASFIPQFTSSVGGAVASWLVHSSPDRAVRVPALARDIVLCSWARHFTLTVPLSNQVYKLVLVNLMLGSNYNPATD